MGVVAFKKLAKDQSCGSPPSFGLTHKTWTFGYGHKKAVAELAVALVGFLAVEPAASWCGRPPSTAPTWERHTTHFGHDHSKGISHRRTSPSSSRSTPAQAVKSPSHANLSGRFVAARAHVALRMQKHRARVVRGAGATRLHRHFSALARWFFVKTARASLLSLMSPSPFAQHKNTGRTYFYRARSAADSPASAYKVVLFAINIE